MRKYLSIDWTGPGKLKSKPKICKMWYSKSINCYLLTNFFSSSVSKLIILVKLGEMGYSNLAAINIEMVAKFTT